LKPGAVGPPSGAVGAVEDGVRERDLGSGETDRAKQRQRLAALAARVARDEGAQFDQPLGRDEELAALLPVGLDLCQRVGDDRVGPVGDRRREFVDAREPRRSRRRRRPRAACDRCRC
jgi:hypothetical protein